ncbi:MAG: hypothetical protein ACFFC7_02335 [Candidatus Hermodarchaeota archaeon]
MIFIEVIIISIDPDYVLVYCMACRTKTTLPEARETGYAICKICNTILCPDCIKAYEGSEPTQHASFMGRPPHPLELGYLPVSDILIFAEKITRELSGELVWKCFYKNEEAFYGRFPILSKKPKKQGQEPDIRMEVPIREEYWRNFGTVITRRNRGKFVSWEKLVTD